MQHLPAGARSRSPPSSFSHTSHCCSSCLCPGWTEQGRAWSSPRSCRCRRRERWAGGWCSPRACSRWRKTRRRATAWTAARRCCRSWRPAAWRRRAPSWRPWRSGPGRRSCCGASRRRPACSGPSCSSPGPGRSAGGSAASPRPGVPAAASACCAGRSPTGTWRSPQPLDRTRWSPPEPPGSGPAPCARR